MQEKIDVRSSDGLSSYSVVFTWDGENLIASCDCRAGVLRQGCRHKEGLLRGDASLLFRAEDRPMLARILQWVNASPIQDILFRLGEAEAALNFAQMEVKKAKRVLVDSLNARLDVTGKYSDE